MNKFLWDLLAHQEITDEVKSERFVIGGYEGVATVSTLSSSSLWQYLVQDLLITVNRHFPSLNALALKCVVEIDDTDTLICLSGTVGFAMTIQEAEKALVASLNA